MGSIHDDHNTKGDDIPIWGTSLPVLNVQEMVRKNPLQVPDRYLRSMEDTYAAAEVQAEIPVIDLSLLSQGDSEELNKLDLTCKNWGFFQVVNHGVPREVIQSMMDAAAEFFDLPLEEKNKYSMPSDDIQGYGHAYVVSDNQKLDWSDLLMLSIYPERFRTLKFWPNTPQHFKDVTESYSKGVKRVMEGVLGSIALAMGLEKNEMSELHRELCQAIRINYYPVCGEPEKVLGVSPHSDSSIITVLMQRADVHGLEIRHNELWVPVKPFPDAFVVNLGDVFEIWTNGKYKSVEHRAMTNKSNPRISIASFVYPMDDLEIEPLKHMVDAERPNIMYRRMKYGEYLRHSLQREMDGKGHTQIAKIEYS